MFSLQPRAVLYDRVPIDLFPRPKTCGLAVDHVFVLDGSVSLERILSDPTQLLRQPSISHEEAPAFRDQDTFGLRVLVRFRETMFNRLAVVQEVKILQGFMAVARSQ